MEHGSTLSTPVEQSSSRKLPIWQLWLVECLLACGCLGAHLPRCCTDTPRCCTPAAWHRWSSVPAGSCLLPGRHHSTASVRSSRVDVGVAHPAERIGKKKQLMLWHVQVPCLRTTDEKKTYCWCHACGHGERPNFLFFTRVELCVRTDVFLSLQDVTSPSYTCMVIDYMTEKFAPSERRSNYHLASALCRTGDGAYWSFTNIMCMHLKLVSRRNSDQAE